MATISMPDKDFLKETGLESSRGRANAFAWELGLIPRTIRFLKTSEVTPSTELEGAPEHRQSGMHTQKGLRNLFSCWCIKENTH